MVVILIHKNKRLINPTNVKQVVVNLTLINPNYTQMVKLQVKNCASPNNNQTQNQASNKKTTSSMELTKN